MITNISRIVDEDGIIRYSNELCQYHREDGPAKIWGNGIVEYWLNDIKYSVEDWEREIIKRKLERFKDL